MVWRIGWFLSESVDTEIELVVFNQNRQESVGNQSESAHSFLVDSNTTIAKLQQIQQYLPDYVV